MNRNKSIVLVIFFIALCITLAMCNPNQERRNCIDGMNNATYDDYVVLWGKDADYMIELSNEPPLKTIAIEAGCSTENQFEEQFILESNYYDESLVVAGGTFEDWCKLAYAEGGVDGPEAMAAVAATTLNRIENPDFPDDFWGVISKSCSYNSVEDGKIWIKEEVPYECEYSMISDSLRHAVWLALAVGYNPTVEKLEKEAIKNGIKDLEKYVGKGALYFYNPDAIDKEEIEARKYVKCKVKIGSQYFYTYWDKE